MRARSDHSASNGTAINRGHVDTTLNIHPQFSYTVSLCFANAIVAYGEVACIKGRRTRRRRLFRLPLRCRRLRLTAPWTPSLAALSLFSSPPLPVGDLPFPSLFRLTVYLV